MRNRLFDWPFIGCLLAVCAMASITQADDIQRTMIIKYAGTYESGALLQEPSVHAELQHLLGIEFDHLIRNLTVRGPVDVSGHALSVAGNAPHEGTNEEAIVCITPSPLRVEAAILSKTVVTIFARPVKYEYLSICIKDWITQVNSHHIDRVKPPQNIRMAPVDP